MSVQGIAQRRRREKESQRVPIGPYIVDFLCVSARLIAEADGSQHGESIRDERRDAYLAHQA